MNLRSFVVSLICIAVTGLGTAALYYFRPQPEQRKTVEFSPSVQVQIAQASNPRMLVRSQGLLEARTLTTAAAEVGGKVLTVAPQFEAGGVFRQDDVLLEIDPADYQSAVAHAESAVAQAMLNIEVEQAKADQSVRDWKKLGRNRKPSDLALRKPQLASTKAQLLASEAGLAKARRDLERTKLLAPYDGRVLRTYTDVASFVPPGARLADFYQSDQLEIRLPISLEDYGFIDSELTNTEVILSTEVAGDIRKWTANVVRQEAEVDRRSRSINLIAALDLTTIKDPLLVPGLFVRAEITGKQLQNVYRLPRLALIKRDRLRIVTPESTLTERTVTIVRAESETILVSGGLQASEQVCLSPVPTFIEGMGVSVLGSRTD